MDYDLSRLSTRSFEQLVQTLATAVIGPGVVVFGDGPDGGREATFEGRIPFPESDPWHGYGIVQAKFRQRSDADTDSKWALKALKAELERLADPERRLRKPDYYLFATNVVLSPVAGTGGKDKADALFKRYRSRLGLKGWRIWDYDQIRTLLDTQTDVRTAYAAWITPGDVLTELLKQMKLAHRDFGPVMANFLQKELCANQYVNLGQAGHSPEDHIPLAQVFVDLPVGDTEPGQESATHEESEANKGIKELMRLAAQRLDPASNPRSPAASDERIRSIRAQVPGRVVLIGGPGQGKSTLTQFLCQLHRAALLATDLCPSPSPEASDACDLIREQCRKESLALPTMPRFPVQVELSHFAAALADQENECQTLLGYLRQRICQRAEQDLSTDDLRAWLRTYP